MNGINEYNARERQLLINENALLRSALETILTYSEMQTFMSQTLAHIQNTARKALDGRYMA